MKKFLASTLTLTTLSIITFATFGCGDNSQNNSKEGYTALVTGNKYYDEDDDYFLDSKKWGNVIKKAINANDFEAINILGDVDIELIQSDQYAVTIQSNEKAIEMYDIEVRDEQGTNTLFMAAKDYTPHKDLVMNPELQLTIEIPSITKINLEGNVDLHIRNEIKLKGDLNINNKSFGEIKIEDLSCKENIFITNADGDIKLKKAKCDSLSIIGLGDGDIDITINAQKINVHNTKASDIDMKVDCKEMTVQNDGKGEIELEGKTDLLKKYDKGLKVKIDTRKLKTTKIEI